MKKQGIKSLAFIAAAGLMTTSCDLLKDLDYAVTPDPLEMHGDSVRIKVDVTFPEKGIRKKAYAEITPSFGGQELRTVTVVGEKATANGQVIPFKPGGTLVYEEVVAYTPEMENTELTVTGKVYKGDKEKGEIEETKLADATIVTPLLVHKDFRVILSKDKFERVTEENHNAQINYLKGRYEVRTSELRMDDIKELESFLAMAQTNPKVEVKSIKITGYASIEGEEDKNNTLSQDRSNSAKEATMKLSAKKEVANEMAQKEESFITTGKGEDYEGFKKALAASSMDKGEKDLIIRILDMYSSSSQREQEIRNLGKTFTYLDKNVFPAQRRSEIVVVYAQIGFSDEELVALSKSNIDTLNVEELLFTATLTPDLNEKLRLYKEGERLFPEDYRPANNTGAVLYMQNKMSEAKAQFEKANNIQDNPESKNNLGAIAGVQGDRENAKALFAEADGAGDEVSYNEGIIAIQDGAYSDAISSFGGEATFNKALAQLLDKDYASAKTTIDNSSEAESAHGYYLKAIIGAREDNLDGVVSNLKAAFAKDASLKSKAMNDREFLKYAENASFTSIVK
jgi:outer membrane protein OmpA-like peptidoglycan-associated protein